MESETIDQSVLPIHLHFCHGKFFVWNPDEILELRMKLGVVGCAVGCYPQKPRQVVQLSLPIQLNNVEAKFVIERVHCVMVDQECFSFSHTTPDLLSKERMRQHEIQTQIKAQEKLNLIDSLEMTIKEGKSKKNQAKQTSSGHVDTNSENNLDIDTCFEELKQTELKKCHQLQTNQLWVKMEHEARILNCHPISANFIQLTPEQMLQYHVYNDLHTKGYFLTDGVKFGGDFLVYPGDPGIYHSMYIVLCVHANKELCAADYAVMGRLATSVKKTLLICSVDENSCVSYLSLAWSGLT